jgi:hypothetical protein
VDLSRVGLEIKTIGFGTAEHDTTVC